MRLRCIALLMSTLSSFANLGCTKPCASDADCEQAACLSGSCVSQCNIDSDCPIGQICRENFICGEAGLGEIRFVSPTPSDDVAEVFSVELEVRFRADEALISVDRSRENEGNLCAPFIPQTVRVQGSRDQEIVQTVTIDGLLSFATDFEIEASIQTLAGEATTTTTVHSSTSDGDSYGGLTPSRVTVNADDLRVATSLGSTSSEVHAVTTIPFGASPGPTRLVRPEGLQLNVVSENAASDYLLLVEGPNGSRCALGVAPLPDPALSEVALVYASQSAGLVSLMLQFDQGTTFVCDREGICASEHSATNPSVEGTHRIAIPDNFRGQVQIAASPDTVSGIVSLMFRVTYRGLHVGFIGPISIDSALGQSAVVGALTIDSSGASLLEQLDIVVGRPF